MSLQVLTPKPSEDAIEELKRMLDMAERGVLQSFVAFGSGTNSSGTSVVYDFEGGKVHLPTLAWAYRMWEVEQANRTEVPE